MRTRSVAKSLLAGIAIALLAALPAHSNTFVVQGYVVNPSEADTSASTYGYDNGGYFGSPFGNLGSLPFSVTWTGDPCGCYGGLIVNGNPTSPITGAWLTIGNVTVDVLAYGGISDGEWLNNGFQVQTLMSTISPTPPWTTIDYGSQNSLTTWDHNNKDTDIGGVVYLHDINHRYQTSAFLHITEWNGMPIPGPVMGAGLPGLILASGGLLAWWRRRQNI